MNKKLLMQLIFIVSLIATLGSLYFSEIRNYIPCELCWYQRILMYPLTIISLIAIIKNDIKANIYILSMSVFGFLIGIYHYSLQKLPAIQDGFNACSDNTCTVTYVNYLGFITIPFMSLTAFFIIIILSIFTFKKEKNYEQ
ncbi:disulfide oxidoreductase [Nosocomiicoccus sp. HMSC067E10]|uniref:disulfide oxidoreductase n=1 Tax=Nosocomiicoccus sp. HMSC067E10 TaxID=1739271 RepID=UPI001FED7905|nr:disulfide oxidoreductase [Nosocomiicoccus sp. HMSC067E10]